MSVNANLPHGENSVQSFPIPILNKSGNLKNVFMIRLLEILQKSVSMTSLIDMVIYFILVYNFLELSVP